MYLVKEEDKMFELLFGECSHIICDKNKKENDKVKLWREVNDGMYWVQKRHKPSKEQFSIIGIQIAGIV
jgi:hypothetical protein